MTAIGGGSALRELDDFDDRGDPSPDYHQDFEAGSGKLCDGSSLPCRTSGNWRQ
jgi:hypothetical protein